jgi:VCBS repeat-containing protein
MERSKSSDIAINPKNSPQIANVATTAAYTENPTLTFLAPALTVSATDGTTMLASATGAITAGYGFGDELSANAAINITGINNAPLISGGISSGAVLFYDNFDSGSLSSEWISVWPTQWVQDGWLHTRDTNGWPRDSEALVHDGDINWRNYSVSLTAGFTPGTPWDNFNVLLRADGFSRSSAGGSGNAYQLNFNGSSGWGSGGQSVSLTRSQGTQNTDLFVGPWTPVGPSANIVASLDEGHIQVSVDGKKIIDLADPSPLLFGGIGVHAIWESEAQFDNIVVKGIFSQQDFKIAENSASGTAVDTVTATDSDVGDTLIYTITAGNSDPDSDSNLAFAINPNTGTITVNDSGDLDYETTPQFNLEVKVTDAGGLSDTGVITVALTNVDEPVNERPEALDATFTLPVNSPTSTAIGTVTATDVDAGDTLTYAITAGNSNPDGDSNLAFTINPTTGVIIVNDRGDLDFDTTPTYNLTVKVTDVGGLFDTAAIEINLNNINESPIAADDAGVGYQTDEDKAFTTVNVLSNDTEPDGDTLTVSSINTTGTTGIATNNGNGTFNYNPNGKFDYLKGGDRATDHFIYTVSDGRGGVDTATVSINIIGDNDAPSFGDEDPILWNRLGSQEEVQNSEVGANFQTRAGVTFVDGVFGGALATEGGEVGGGGYLTMNPDQFFPAEQTQGTVEVWMEKRIERFTPFGSPLLGIFGNQPYGGGYDSISAFWSDGFTGFGGIQFQIVDSSGAIHIANDLGWNEIPVGEWVHLGFAWDLNGIDGTEDKLRLYRDGVLVGKNTDTISGINSSAQEVRVLGHHAYSRFGEPTAYLDNLKVWGFAKTDFSDRFVEGVCKTLAFSLPENSPNSTQLGIVTATDVDAADTLSYAITAGNSDPDGNGNYAFTINPTTGAITVNDSGDLDYEATPQFNLEVKVTDAGGLFDTDAITVALTNVAEPGNDRPEAQDANFSVPEKSPFGSAVGSAQINDVDAGDTLAFAILAGNSDPDGDTKAAFAIKSTTGVITVNDSDDLIFKTMPQFKLQVAATDASGLSDTSDVTIILTNINDAPVGSNKTVVMPQNAVYTFNVSDFGFADPNDSPPNSLLAVKVHTLPLSGNLTYSGVSVSEDQFIPVAGIAGGLFKFAPVANTTGTGYANFSFQVQDDGGIANGGLDLDPTPNNISINVTAGGGSWGDPHMFTFDGLHYDFQARGDFILVRALDSDLEIQVRQAPWHANPQATLNVGLATVIDGSDVVFDVSQPHPLVNGSALMLAMGESQPLGGGSLSRTSISNYGIQGDLYTLSYATGDRLDVQLFPDFCLDPTVYLIHSQQVVGLLGNNNGRADDDLALRDGTMPPDPLAAEHLYGAFATDWLVAPADSLFTRMEQAVATPSLPQEGSSPAALAGPAAAPLAALAHGDALAPTAVLTSLEAAGEHPDLLIQPGYTIGLPTGILGTGMVDTQWSGWQAELEVSAISPPLDITDPNQATTFLFPFPFGTDLTDALPNHAAL